MRKKLLKIRMRRLACCVLVAGMVMSVDLSKMLETGLWQVKAEESSTDNCTATEKAIYNVADTAGVQDDNAQDNHKATYPTFTAPSAEEIEKWKQDGTWESRLSYMREQISGTRKSQAATFSVASNSRLSDVTFSDRNAALDANDPKRLLRMQNTMPSIGNVKALVFMVQFEDCKNTDESITKESIQNEYFGEQEKGNYPTESLTNYYKRSSYGKMNISGEVYGWLDLQHEKAYYNKDNNGDDLILKEILDAYDAQIDFSEYDSDKDGVIDSIYILYAGKSEAWGDFYWNYKTNMAEEVNYDNVRPNGYVFQTADESGSPHTRLITAIHETGHLLGLEDYYSYDLAGATFSSSVNEMGGLGFLDMMDHNYGDHNIFSKLLLGWVSPVFVTEDSEVELKAISDEGATAVIITPNQDATIFSEYYLLELYNDTKNNSNSAECANGGVRLYHVNARTEQYEDGSYYFKYNNMYGHQSEYKLIKLLESDGSEENSLLGLPIAPTKYYYAGMEFGPNTAPSSEFYEGVYTGIHLYFKNVEKETATVSVKFDAADKEKPSIINTSSRNVLGDVMMSLNDYKIFFDSYIYAAEQFANIKFYDKNEPNSALNITAKIVNAREGNGLEEPIFKDSISGYNQLAISAAEDLKNNTEYILEIPEGAIKDAYGNTNERIVQYINTVKTEDNITYKNYNLKEMPNGAPDDYKIEDVGICLRLSDASLVFAFAAIGTNIEGDAVIVLKRFLADGSNVLDRYITLQKCWMNNSAVKMLIELKNGNFLVLLNEEYVVTDKEGNLIAEVVFDKFVLRTAEGTKYIDRGNFIDIYHYFYENRYVYRVAKVDGTCSILTQFPDELQYDKELQFYDENYENRDEYLYNITYFSPFDRIEAAEQNASWIKGTPHLISGTIGSSVADVPLTLFQDNEKIVFERISHNVSSLAFTGLGVVSTNVYVVDKNRYKVLEMKVWQTDGVSEGNTVSVQNGDGYLVSVANHKSSGNHWYRADGSYLLRMDQDCNVKWAAFCDTKSSTILGAYYDNGKITAIMGSDVVELEDIDNIYYSTQRTFSFDEKNLKADEKTQSISVLSDFTVKDAKAAIQGTCGELHFFDSEMNKVTEDDDSLLNGMIRIDSVDGICKWYYKVQKPQVTSSGITVEFQDLQQDAVELHVDEINEHSENFAKIKEIISENCMEGTTQINAKIYDITLKDSTGTDVQPKGKVTIKMIVPAGYDGTKCKVYYVNAKDEFVDVKAFYNGNCMIFETTHFSTYLITDTQMKAVEEQSAVYGDANNDGTVNSKDVVMMKKHLAGYEVDIDLKACDVNGDGAVNSKDVVLVMKKLAGYDVVLGKQ